MIWKSGMFSICLGHTFTINDSRFFNAAFVQTWRETWKSSSNGEDMFLVGCYAAQMRWKREDMSIFSNFGRSNISFWEVHWCKRILKLTSTKTSIVKSNSKNQPHPTTVKLRAHSTWRFSYWKLPFLLLIALLPGSSTPATFRHATCRGLHWCCGDRSAVHLLGHAHDSDCAWELSFHWCKVGSKITSWNK